MLTDADILDVEVGGKVVEFRFLFTPIATIDVSVENVYSVKRTEVILGLAATVKEVGEKSPAAQVLRAVEKYKDPQVPVPPGTTEQVLRFLCVSASEPGLWERMGQEEDPRIADVLIGYYVKGENLRALAKRIQGMSHPTQVARLRDRGVRWLYDRLPEQTADFPINKHTDFDLKQLMATAVQRRTAAAAALEPQMGRLRGNPEEARRVVLHRFYVVDDRHSAS